MVRRGRFAATGLHHLRLSAVTGGSELSRVLVGPCEPDFQAHRDCSTTPSIPDERSLQPITLRSNRCSIHRHDLHLLARDAASAKLSGLRHVAVHLSSAFWCSVPWLRGGGVSEPLIPAREPDPGKVTGICISSSQFSGDTAEPVRFTLDFPDCKGFSCRMSGFNFQQSSSLVDVAFMKRTSV